MILLAQGNTPPGNQTVLPGSGPVTQFQFMLTNPISSSVTMTSLTLTDTGSGNAPMGIAAVEVMRNGVVVASGNFAGNQAVLPVNNALAANSTATYSVVVIFTATASGTYQLGFATDLSLSGISGNNGRNALFSGAPLQGALVTVTAPTLTPTETSTPTLSPTPTPTFTPTWTWTPTLTPTMAPTGTWTQTPTPAPETFFIDRNLFQPPDEVSIRVAVQSYPGNFSLRIYNTAGEMVRLLDERPLSAPFADVFTWDGRNDNHEMCASGVYIIYLVEPLNRRLARVMFIH